MSLSGVVLPMAFSSTNFLLPPPPPPPRSPPSPSSSPPPLSHFWAVRLPSASVSSIDQSVAQSNARQVKRRLPGQHSDNTPPRHRLLAATICRPRDRRVAGGWQRLNVPPRSVPLLRNGPPHPWAPSEIWWTARHGTFQSFLGPRHVLWTTLMF